MSHHKLTHPQLVEFLNHQIDTADSNSLAVIIIVLRRTDRLEAITGKVPFHSILNHVDQRLSSLLRDADRYAHISSDQVMLVLPNLANQDHCVLAASRILTSIRQSFSVGENAVLLRPYLGIANFPESTRESNQLLMNADIALRIASTDEHGFYVFQAKDGVETKTYNGLDVALDLALNANELSVNYQPKVGIQDGICSSAEALIRWTAPWGQEINPAVLVETAEDSGLINPLTLWILNTALRHIAGFSKAGVNIGVSVNLPPKMLEVDELPQIIQQALDIWGIPASTLTLEITESSMFHNIEASITMLSRLRELGLRLSIDDFGTGYSSLAYLKRLPVQELKIDLMFVSNIHHSVRDKHIVRTIIDLAHNFELITVAEGVEDKKTLELLRDLGCDVAQGYLFSRPLPESRFVDWHQSQS